MIPFWLGSKLRVKNTKKSVPAGIREGGEGREGGEMPSGRKYSCKRFPFRRFFNVAGHFCFTNPDAKVFPSLF